MRAFACFVALVGVGSQTHAYVSSAENPCWSARRNFWNERCLGGVRYQDVLENTCYLRGKLLAVAAATVAFVALAAVVLPVTGPQTVAEDRSASSESGLSAEATQGLGGLDEADRGVVCGHWCGLNRIQSSCCGSVHALVITQACVSCCSSLRESMRQSSCSIRSWDLWPCARMTATRAG